MPKQKDVLARPLAVVPAKRRHEVLHNQRGRLLETVLKARTDVIVARLPFRLHE